jgi:hypothetical protein
MRILHFLLREELALNTNRGAYAGANRGRRSGLQRMTALAVGHRARRRSRCRRLRRRARQRRKSRAQRPVAGHPSGIRGRLAGILRLVPRPRVRAATGRAGGFRGVSAGLREDARRRLDRPPDCRHRALPRSGRPPEPDGAPDSSKRPGRVCGAPSASRRRASPR